MGSNSDSTDESAASSAPDSYHSDAQPFELQYAVLGSISGVIFHNTNRKGDDRFLYIKAAIDELLHGSYGMDGMNGITSNVIASESNPRYSPTTNIRSTNGWASRERAIVDIALSTIFEIISIYGITITTEQAQIVLDKKIIPLLYQLHTISKDLPPPSVQQSDSTHNIEDITADKSHVFNYHMKIDQKVDQVRVIKLLPGSENDPIKCHLTLCDVLGGGIEEALSYVWGTGGSKKNILVSQQSYPKQPFPVRENLYEILHSLRLTDATRTIWIDAICIDQSNSRERTHQVRLMRDIYTHAKRVVIWLGTDQTSLDVNFDSDSHWAPLPLGFGGTTVHEYDLMNISKEYQEHLNEPHWTVKKAALQYMLLRCLGAIFSHKWWGRIWTLQESVLPHQAPTIIFRGYQFSFDNLATALEVAKQSTPFSDEIFKKLDEISGSKENEEAQQVLFRIKKTESRGLRVLAEPMLVNWRRLKPNLDFALYRLLSLTGAFQATDPRDKVYALESLLHRFAGKLICIDYSEDYKTVFRRVTARCYNVYYSLDLSIRFPFFFEAPICGDNLPSCPSWVLNFTFSDAMNRNMEHANTASEKVTLENVIFVKGAVYPRFIPWPNTDPIFATPSTLFCTGSSIDSICNVGIISANGEDQFGEVLIFALSVRDQRRSIIAWAPEDGYVDPMQDYYAKFGDAGREEISLMVFFSLLYDYMVPGVDVNELIGFSSLISDYKVPKEKSLKIRFKDVNGKTYFITKKGLVGMATAPVQEGDIFALLHNAPLYFVLREVDAQIGDAKGEQKHRIVARATICDMNFDIEKWFKSLPRRDFRIV